MTDTGTVQVHPGLSVLRPAAFGALFQRCAAATTVADACAALADELHERFELPSIYLLVDGRLRCQAARGYFQVVDGFTPSTGVIGRVVSTGRPVVVHDVHADPDFIAAIPGLTSAACLPVRCGGAVVGAISLESGTRLPDDVVAQLAVAAQHLGVVIDRLGGLPPVPLAQRLARIAVGLTSLTDSDEIRLRAVEGAVEVSGMSSAALSQPDETGAWVVLAATGPLAATLAEWDDALVYRVGGDELAVLLPADGDDAGLVAQRLVDAARRVRTTVSIGLAIIGPDSPQVARLRADKALYRAKSQGRDRYAVTALDD